MKQYKHSPVPKITRPCMYLENVSCTLCTAGSGTVWDDVPCWHFLGQLESTPSLLFWKHYTLALSRNMVLTQNAPEAVCQPGCAWRVWRSSLHSLRLERNFQGREGVQGMEGEGRKKGKGRGGKRMEEKGGRKGGYRVSPSIFIRVLLFYTFSPDATAAEAFHWW